MIGFLIINIIMHLFAIYFAYKLLKCDLAEKKWVFYLVIILHTFSLLLATFSLIIFIFFKNLYNNSFNFVYKKKSNNIPSEVSKFTLTFVGVLLFIFIILSIFLIFVDLYFLYKLFECDTTGFLIYIIVLLVNVIMRVL